MSIAVTVFISAITWITLHHFYPHAIQLLSMVGRRCQQLLRHRRVDAFLAYCKANLPPSEACIFWASWGFDVGHWMMLVASESTIISGVYYWRGGGLDIQYYPKGRRTPINGYSCRTWCIVLLVSLVIYLWDCANAIVWIRTKKYPPRSHVFHCTVLGITGLQCAFLFLVSPFKYLIMVQISQLFAASKLLLKLLSGAKPPLTATARFNDIEMIAIATCILFRCLHQNYIVADKFCKVFLDSLPSQPDELREKNKGIVYYRSSYRTPAFMQAHDRLQSRPYSAGITDDILRESRRLHRAFNLGALPPVSQDHPLFEHLKIDAQSSVLTELPVPMHPSVPTQDPISSRVSAITHPSSPRTSDITDAHQSPRSEVPQVSDTPRRKLVDFYNQLFSDKENTDSINPKSQVISKPRVSLDDLCAQAQQVLGANPELSGDALLDAIKKGIDAKYQDSPSMPSSSSAVTRALDAHTPYSSRRSVAQPENVSSSDTQPPVSFIRGSAFQPMSQVVPSIYVSPAEGASSFTSSGDNSVARRSNYHMR